MQTTYRISRKLQKFFSLAAAASLATACNIVEPGTTFSIPRAVTTPQPAASGMHFVTLTSGFFHSCALEADGRAWCWGDNAYRQTGQSKAGVPCDETSTCTLTPAPVETQLRFKAISAGVTHSCAIAMDDSAWCWGGGYSSGRGMLGDGALTQSAIPVPVAGGLRFTSVSAGGRLTCALSIDGRAYCWGSGGVVGDGRSVDALAPVEVAGKFRFISLAAGVSHACGVTSQQAMYCWGTNQSGQLGNGQTSDITSGSLIVARSPVRVEGDIAFQSVSAGADHTCGLTLAGEASCWGDNHVGEVGSGQPGPPASRPMPVVGAHRFTNVAAGTVHTCGLDETGTALCWGGNWFGGLGDGTSKAANTGGERGTPGAVKTAVKFRAIAPGGSHTCGLAIDGRVWCWGDRARGQMGDGRA